MKMRISGGGGGAVIGEVADTLEPEPFIPVGIGKGWLHLASGEDGQGVGDGEEAVVGPDLGVDGMSGRDPVERSPDAPVRWLGDVRYLHAD